MQLVMFSLYICLSIPCTLNTRAAVGKGGVIKPDDSRGSLHHFRTITVLNSQQCCAYAMLQCVFGTQPT